eukprot:scaffold5997_cov133-Cylindrotheca_fusiformis.AAC.4
MSSSLGLKLSLPPEVASRLRESEEQQETAAVERTEEIEVAVKEVPQITIDLERLVGYQPEAAELETIKLQLLSAMWTRYRLEERETAEPSSTESSPTEPPPDFDFQVVDLLESGVASFAQPSDGDSEESKKLLLSYPLSIIASDGETKSTSTLWERTTTCPSKFVGKDNTEFVPRLWKYLTYCSRNLNWKYQMSLELGNLVEEEQARIDYNEWTSIQRKAKLDQLYSIRETIVHQVDISKAKYDSMVEDREIQVQMDMRQHHRQAAVGTSELSFPDEFALLGLNDRPELDEDDWGLGDSDSYMVSDESSEDGISDEGYETDNEPKTDVNIRAEISNDEELERGYECDNDDDEPVPTDKTGVAHEELATAIAPDPPNTSIETSVDCPSEQPPTNPTVLSPFQKRKERQRRAKQRKRIEKKEAMRRAEKEKLEQLEKEIRENRTSKDIIIAQTLAEALTKKLESVEELLEALQEEEWQAEEERENEVKTAELADHSSEESFSLLDQILAMILGTMPMSQSMSPKEHYQFVQKEHKSIVSGWKSHFGRLPPSIGGIAASGPRPSDRSEMQEKQSPSQLRRELGITDNTDEDWDADVDWSESMDRRTDEAVVDENKTISKPASSDAKPRIIGLRPGGRIEQ